MKVTIEFDDKNEDSAREEAQTALSGWKFRAVLDEAKTEIGREWRGKTESFSQLKTYTNLTTKEDREVYQTGYSDGLEFAFEAMRKAIERYGVDMGN